MLIYPNGYTSSKAFKKGCAAINSGPNTPYCSDPYAQGGLGGFS